MVMLVLRFLLIILKAFFDLLLISAVIHTPIIFWNALQTKDLEKVSVVKVWQLDALWPSLSGNFWLIILSPVVWLVILVVLIGYRLWKQRRQLVVTAT